jgi:hypothetical protein
MRLPNPNQVSLRIQLRQLEKVLFRKQEVLPFEMCFLFLHTLPLLVIPFISVHVNQLAKKAKFGY